MALSDSCFEFLEAVVAASRELAQAVHRYSAPDYPLQYGEEIDALRRACLAMAEAPYDPIIGAQLLRLATSVMQYHDMPPGDSEEPNREAEMARLIRLLEAGACAGNASAMPSIVRHVIHESHYSERASARLKAILPTLGEATSAAALSMINDIGSVTAKRVLELPMRTKVFVSYSHADSAWLDRLKRHLRPLVREGHIESWDDTHIQPGDDWRQEIRIALSAARVAVLLISADFFASDFIDEAELPPLLAAAEAEGVRILPVILSASRFLRTPGLAQFQAVNSPSQPLAKMSPAEQDEVLDRLAHTIEKAFGSR